MIFSMALCCCRLIASRGSFCSRSQFSFRLTSLSSEVGIDVTRSHLLSSPPSMFGFPAPAFAAVVSAASVTFFFPSKNASRSSSRALLARGVLYMKSSLSVFFFFCSCRRALPSSASRSSSSCSRSSSICLCSSLTLACSSACSLSRFHTDSRFLCPPVCHDFLFKKDMGAPPPILTAYLEASPTPYDPPLPTPLSAPNPPLPSSPRAQCPSRSRSPSSAG